MDVSIFMIHNCLLNLELHHKIDDHPAAHRVMSRRFFANLGMLPKSKLWEHPTLHKGWIEWIRPRTAGVGLMIITATNSVVLHEDVLLKDRGDDLSRRAFLQRSSAALGLLAAHDAMTAAAAPPSMMSPATAARDEPLIRRLRLLTAVPLARMREFYHEKIGFAVIDESKESIAFQAGLTPLTFVTARPEQLTSKGGRGNGQPFYHFAFNIPHNKILAARHWQLQRSAVVPTPENLRDPAYPDDVRHFRGWNAHSIFFFDPAFNIVEYIARHDLKNDAPDPDAFTVKDILYASEIGFVSDQPQRDRNAKLLHNKLGLKAYPPGTTDDWWAMGDERGLLLCLGNKGGVWGDNTDTPVTWDVWETHATVRGEKAGELALEGLPYRIKIESD